MKRALLPALAALFLAGCAEQIELTEPPDAREEAVMPGQPQTRALTGAVYNEVVDAWMIPQADPYTLENFQKAYDNLAAGRSAQTLTKTQAAKFVADGKLEPTHYALKIYPKSEEEQWRVETMEDVRVSYHPFDYSMLTTQEAEKVSQAGTRSTAATFTEKSPYTVTYDYTNVTDGGPTGPVNYQLPILYTVWPVGKPLPEDMEYVVDYEVFLPYAFQTESIGTLDILEYEAVALAWGLKTIPTRPMTRGTSYITGTLKAYDNVLNKNVPLANFTILRSIGSNLTEFVTDSNGYFSIPYTTSGGSFGGLIYSLINELTQYIPVYKSHVGKWIITTDGSTAPYQGAVMFNGLDAVLGDVIVPAGDRKANEIHRAVNYFFNNQSVFPTDTPSGGMKIRAYNSPSSSGSKGWFYPANKQIIVYNYGGTNGEVIGTTLHEIGHFAHCVKNYSNYVNTHVLLQEAFADYSGRYLGQEYYKSLGWVHPSGDPQIVGTSRQDWTKDTSNYHPSGANYGWYSPLFIDLTDDYNQSVYISNTPDDKIKNVPPSAIWNIITNSTSWAQCRARIVSSVGTQYYSGNALNVWIADFDHWFDNYWML